MRRSQAGTIVALREGIAVHHVSLKGTRDYAVYQAIEVGKVDHIELLEAIIYDLTGFC